MMADKMPNEIVIPSCSKYEVINTELCTEKNEKRKLSISESEYDYNDHNATFNCETSTNEKSLCKDNQSNVVCKRTSESLSDVIQKLTQQIEHIEKNVASSQTFMKTTEVNDVNCDVEHVYQSPNKIIKCDTEIMNGDSSNSDENRIRSDTQTNTTKHVNKKIKLDKNIHFQEDIDDSKSNSKSLTNQEVEMLLDLSYKFDDEIIFDQEDSICIKTHKFQTIKDDSVDIPKQAETLNTSIKHDVLFESKLDNKKSGISNENQSMSLSDEHSTSSINQSREFGNDEIEVLDGKVLLTQMFEDDVADDRSDPKSIDQNEFLDLTKCVNDEDKLDHENCTSIINEVIKSTSESKCVNVVENILEPVDETCIASKSLNTLKDMGFEFKNSIPPYELPRTLSDTEEYNNNNFETRSKSFSNKKLIESRSNDEKIPSENDQTIVSVIIENGAHKIDSVDIPNQAETLNTSIKHDVLFESKLDNKKSGISIENQSMSLSNERSTSSINQSREFDNDEIEILDGKILLTQTFEDDVDDSSDPKRIDQNEFLDLTKSVKTNDEDKLDHENCTSIINDVIKSPRSFDSLNSEIQTNSEEITQCSADRMHKSDFGRMIVGEGKSQGSTKYLDHQEYKCERNNLETLNNHEKNNVEPSNTVDNLPDTNILENENGAEQKNESTLKKLSDENEVTLTKLLYNEDDGLGIVTDCTDKIIVSSNCEDNVNENKSYSNQEDLSFSTKHACDIIDSSINNKRKRSSTSFTDNEVFIMPVEVSDHTNYNSLSTDCGQLNTTADNYEDALSERNSQSLYAGDQLNSNMFYFGTENCRDVSVCNIDSSDCYGINNCSRHNTTVHSMEINDSFISKSVVNVENTLEPNNNSCLNSMSQTIQEEMSFVVISHINPLQRAVSETYEYNNDIDTSSKSLSDKKLNESRRHDGNIPFDNDQTTTSLIENGNQKMSDIQMNTTKHVNKKIKLDKNINFQEDIDDSKSNSKSLTNQEVEMLLDLSNKFDDGIIFDQEDNICIKTNKVHTIKDDSVDIPDQAETLNRSIKHGVLFESKLDSQKSVISIENQSVNVIENILEPVDETCIASKSLNTLKDMGFEFKNSIPPYELPRTLSDTEEYNNNDFETRSKSFSNTNLIESRSNNEKIPSENDSMNVSVIIENGALEIDSVDIPKQAETLNTSIKHDVLFESKLDNKKSGISNENQSMSLSDEHSTSSINQSREFGNNEIEVLDGKVLLTQMFEDDVADDRNPKSIDQNEFLDLTKCVNDEDKLDHENCTSIINEGIKSTRSFDSLNSEIQTNSEEITQCSADRMHKSDFGRMIVGEGKSQGSTKYLDHQEYKCERNNLETLNNHEKNNVEPSNTVDNLPDTNILENENGAVQKNESTLKKLSNEDEETLTKLLYNEDDGLGIVTDCTEKIIVSSNCEDNVNENKSYSNREDLSFSTKHACDVIDSSINNKRKRSSASFTDNEVFIMPVEVSDHTNYNSLSTDCGQLNTTTDNYEDALSESVSTTVLELTRHVCDEYTTTVRKRSDQLNHLNTSINHDFDETIYNSKKVDTFTGRSLSFNSSDAKRIHESSNGDSEHLDDSFLFMPSSRDLVRYGIVCEEHDKSISQSLNNLENVCNKENVPQCKSPCIKLKEVSKSINNLVSSSYAKDYEDNVIDFYDCELSSIENSDVEDNLLLSFEKDTSIKNSIFDQSQDKFKNVTNSTSNEQTSDSNVKIQNLSSSSEFHNNLTNAVEISVSSIYSHIYDHQYNKVISTSISKKQMQMNPDADNLESLNHSNVTITTSNTLPSFNDPDNMKTIQSDNLCINQGNFNKEQNLERSNTTYQNNENKSISGYNTHQNIKESQKSNKDDKCESSKVSSMKITGDCTINSEEMAKINTAQSSSSNIDQSEIDKKKYIDEIVKNEQLFNNEKLDENESVISPFISQSLAKSINLKKATANTNIHAMGDKALCTYLTQQTMTLDVLKVLHKSLDTCPSSGVLMEDPEGLVVPLMPHQKHAIAWLIWRESQEPHGGILADDMGLGKTLSMISLILKLKEKPQYSLLPVVSIDSRNNDDIIGGTLVICPASLLNQWENEVRTKLKPGLLKVGQYYGINRSFSALELSKNDLVTTSYHVVMWDHKIRQNSSPLFKIKWNRIILDEGHNIRNHKTQTSIAVCNIKSLNRWAITGTPVHNKEADFFTLLKFVGCKPFDDWPVYKRWVGNNDDAGKHRLSLLVKTLMLRRTKIELTQFTTFNLPAKEINTIEIELSKEERSAYEKLLLFSSNLFATYLYDRAAKEKVFDSSVQVQSKVQYFQEQNQDKGEVFKDHPELLKLFKQFRNIEEIQTYHILVLLLRLRQICCHPVLIKGPITAESIKNEDNESISENENVLSDSYNDNTDIIDLMSSLKLEDEPIKKNSAIDSNKICDIFQNSWISTKIKKICDLVNEKVLINGNGDKAIIVSQWPSFLYLIQKNLALYNVKMEMFSGAVPISKRNKIINDFNNPNGGPKILLLSLKAGGVGLNLMAANHMFMVDIHWNPQLENQASDRIYRVGQTKPVNIYKFICSNTIETRILNIQEKKLQIAENVFRGTSVISSKITIDDLKQIFQFK